MLIVLFLALGHHFVLSLSSSTSGNSRTCLGSPGSRRPSVCVCCGSWWSSVLGAPGSWAGRLGSAGLSCAGPGGAEGLNRDWGEHDSSRALAHKAEGHCIAVCDARTCALQEDINWIAHSSVVGLEIPKSCTRPPSSQPSLSGSSFSLGCRLAAARALLQLPSWGGVW